MKRPEVLRQRDFRRFFVGQSVSLLGDEAATLAIPLTAVLTLHAGPRELGLLTAAGIVPSLFFSLAAGAWVDRRGRRRRTMLVADLLRALAIGSLPIAYALGHLGLLQLTVVAFVVGTLDVAFFVAYQALLVAVVPRADYLAANALLNGSRSVADVVGLSLGGVLVGLVTAPGALVLDAVSFVVSGTELARIHPVEPPAAAGERRGLLVGARWIRGNPVVGTLLASSAVINFFSFAGNAVMVLFASRTLHLGPALIGVVFGAGAVGGVLGAATCGRVTRRLGLGRTLVAGTLVFPLAMLLFPAARGPVGTAVAFLLAGELIGSWGVLWLDISIGAVFAREIPDALRSRVAGAHRTVNYGVRPVGALLGGFLGSGIGLRETLWLSAGGAIVGSLLIVRPAILDIPAAAS